MIEKLKLTRGDLTLASRLDLHVFAERAFRANVDGYEHFPYLDVIGAKFAEAIDQAGRLVVALPPRHLKTWYTVALMAWYLGHNPGKEVMYVTHSLGVGRDVASKLRALVASDLMREVFPNLATKSDRDAVMDFRTLAGGGFVVGSFESGLTGRGASLLVIDDPIAANQASSETVRESVRNAFDGMLMSRLNNPAKDCVILVGHRVHADDLASHVLRNGFDLLCLPFAAIEDEHIEVRGVVFERKKDEVLQPGRRDKASVGVGPEIFAVQYQQQPQSVRGNVLRRQYFPIDAAVPTTGHTVISWDSASSQRPTASYSVGLVFKQVGDISYLVHVIRERAEFARLKEIALRYQASFRPDIHLIENAHLGVALAEALKEDGANVSLRSTGNQSKLERVQAQMHKIEAQRVHVARDAAGAEGFLSEIEAFPHGSNDDQVDALVQYLAWVGTAVAKPEKVILGSSGRMNPNTRFGFVARFLQNNRISSPGQRKPYPRKPTRY